MPNVFFIGDLHFGHTGITNFRKQFPTEQVHTNYIMDTWKETVHNKDIVYVMGDAAFTFQGLTQIGTLPGRKILVRGNHDTLPTEEYLSVFDEILGCAMYKEFWLSHVPVHESELYGRTNIHGHCHRGGPTTVHESKASFRGKPIGTRATYINVCAEFINYKPISLQEVRDLTSKRLALGYNGANN